MPFCLFFGLEVGAYVFGVQGSGVESISIPMERLKPHPPTTKPPEPTGTSNDLPLQGSLL